MCTVRHQSTAMFRVAMLCMACSTSIPWLLRRSLHGAGDAADFLQGFLIAVGSGLVLMGMRKRDS